MTQTGPKYDAAANSQRMAAEIERLREVTGDLGERLTDAGSTIARLRGLLEDAEANRARLLVDNGALRAALGDVEALADHAARSGDLEGARRASSLARLVRLDRNSLEDDE